jgi:hypothetical protein
MTFIVDGTNGLTFPNSTVQASAGNVLQVVQGTVATSTYTTSTTPVATGLTASITPKFATSKIMVVSSYSIYTVNSAGKVYTSLYRNSTNLSTSAGGAYLYNSAGQAQATTGISLIDSPATTSSTSYTIYVFSTSASYNVAFNPDLQNAYIILMEIAA